MRSTRRKTHYEILGVKQTASPEDVKRAFRRRAMRHHPDRNPDDPKAHAKFNRISEAYEVLSDPGQRQIYDLTLALSFDNAPAPPQPPPPPREHPRPAAGSYEQWVEERERQARQAREAARQRMRETAGSKPAPKARGGSRISAVWGLVVLVVFIVRIVANCA